MTLNSVGFFVFSFLMLWLGAQLGSWLGRRSNNSSEGVEDFRIMLGATLSLLGLLIGFSLSMSISGFNNRQSGEEMEASAINAAFIRSDLLPRQDSQAIQAQLLVYLEKRLQFYNKYNPEKRHRIVAETSLLQDNLWATISVYASAHQTPVVALAVTGINDVINAQKKTQASWRNQIPLAAWSLLIVVAMCCSIMMGYNSRPARRTSGLLLVLPMTISMSFMMIADIDVPGQGIIRVSPTNLEQLHETAEARLTIGAELEKSLDRSGLSLSF